MAASKIAEVYEILLKSYGPQGWWPLLDEKLVCRHSGKLPETKDEIFQICAGAILTQNTNWYPNVTRALQQLALGKLFDEDELESVKHAEIMAGEVSKNNEDSLKKGSTPRLKKKGSQHMPYGSIQNNSLLSIDKIRKANQEKIAGLVRPAGYYNQKAERLKIIAGFLSKNKSPTRQQLLGLNGVGPETADSILLYAFNKPSFVIDAYTKRIFGRLGYSADDYDGWQRLFMESLPEDTGIFSEYHALLVELGKNHCKNKPLCKGCPLTGVCGEKRFHKI